jgi:hypothetical protein
MIPNHLLADLAAGNRIAVLSRDGGIHFHVHAASDTPAAIEAFAAREGSRVLATHLGDHAAIRELLASREPDIGGEG